jgi:hypothetical protein
MLPIFACLTTIPAKLIGARNGSIATAASFYMTFVIQLLCFEIMSSFRAVIVRV